MLLIAIVYALFAFGNAQGDPCANSTLLSSVVEESYMNHVDLIRQSLPMEMVKFFYDDALQRIAVPECLCTTFETEVDLNCVNDMFVNDNGWISSQLLDIMTDDSLLPITERLFPYVELREDLPALRQLEQKAIAEGRETTIVGLNTINEPYWSGAQFPSDELLRFDREQDRACDEFAQKIDENSLWLPATALSAYVIGIAQQIFLLPGSTTAAETMLMEHARMVYLAARCKRVTGDHLRVPAVFLEGFITRAHLALKNSSSGPLSAFVAGFPKITSVPEIIRGTRHFFPEALIRISSLNSFGRATFLSWNRTHVFNDNLKDVIQANATLQEYNDFYSAENLPDVNTVLCGTGFKNNTRLTEVSDEHEKCCSNSCMRFSGSSIKRSIMNEMCCEACNELGCNVDDLAQVMQTQAYGFDRERESSVANVW